MVFDDNYGQLDNEKALLYAKRWFFYVNGKKMPIKSGYSV